MKSVLNHHWKDWCWSWNSNTLAIWYKNWFIGKDPDTGKDWRQEEKGTTEDEMVGWHHQLNGHEFEQALGVGDGQPGVLQSMGSQKAGHDWVTELNWISTINSITNYKYQRWKEVFTFIFITLNLNKMTMLWVKQKNIFQLYSQYL